MIYCCSTNVRCLGCFVTVAVALLVLMVFPSHAQIATPPEGSDAMPNGTGQVIEGQLFEQVLIGNDESLFIRDLVEVVKPLSVPNQEVVFSPLCATWIIAYPKDEFPKGTQSGVLTSVIANDSEAVIVGDANSKFHRSSKTKTRYVVSYIRIMDSKLVRTVAKCVILYEMRIKMRDGGEDSAIRQVEVAYEYQSEKWSKLCAKGKTQK